MSEGWQTRLASELEAWAAPLTSTGGSPDSVLMLLAAMNWRFEDLPAGNQQKLGDVVASLSTNCEALFETLRTPPPEIEDFLADVGVKLVPIVADVATLATALPIGLPASTAELPGDVLNWLTINWLQRRHPAVYAALRLLGVIQNRPRQDELWNGVVFHTKNATPRLAFDSLLKWTSKPEDILKDTYWPNGFADGGAGALTLATRGWELASELGLSDYIDGVDGEVFKIDGLPANTVQISREFLMAEGLTAEAGVRLQEVPVGSGGPGVDATPYGEAAFQFDAGAFKAMLSGTLAANPIRLTGAGISQIDASKPTFGASLVISRGDSSTPAFTIGGANGFRLSLDTLSLLASTELTQGRSRAVVGIDLQTFKFKLGGGKGDGFLNKILPAQGIGGEGSFGIDWSTDGGLAVRGGGGLTITMPTHLEIGPISVDQITFGARIANGAMPVELSATLSAKLGPLSAVVERMGILATISFPDGGGNLGPANIDFGFKPPNGVGLSINAGVVKGGGYLYFNFDEGEYAGALELNIADFLYLKAIGLITTKMPDGSKGFSLLIIITAEFNPGFQLGYGFKLIGVGGLLGLNRTMLLQPLALGVRTGAVNGILFPVDPVKNAPRIISDLKTIFPPALNNFLIGPMAKIGWGTPTVISLELGIIIEIPGNVAILGVLRLALGESDGEAILILQVNFIGALEFDKKRGWFFAAIFDSRLLTITIEGEMGILIAVGDDANFLISAGGFHPSFTPPPLPFPSPKRIAFSLIDSPYASIRVEAYFALTTNTVQFGTSAQLKFDFSVIVIEGHFSFDALMRFSPLYFIVEVSAGCVLKVAGQGVFNVDLGIALEGPTPWRARGHAEVSVLCFKVSKDFDETWGDVVVAVTQPVALRALIEAETVKTENWRALPPPFANLQVTLRTVAPSEFILHPLGAIEFSQNTLPLELPIDKVGEQPPADWRRIQLGVTGGDFRKSGTPRRSFAPAQFQNMSDAQKLSAPAFQSMVSGIQVNVADSYRAGSGVQRTVRYDEILIDTLFRRLVAGFVLLSGFLFGQFVMGAAITKSESSASRKKQKQPFADTIAVSDERYSVVFTHDNRSATTAFPTEAAAREWMNGQVTNDPALSRTLHVIPTVETSLAS
ncbi:MAG: DUF6603 domain-containing protein [Rhizobiaceae bacterium]